jgi:predicted glycogen debranching enzyme
MVTRFGPQVCGTLAAGGAREWLVADGRGGYASGTVSGLRTRRYHGLLVVAGPTGRMLGLASLDPIVRTTGGAEVRLATHEWASGAVRPEGHRFLETFELVDGAPRWRWRVGETVLRCDLAMRTGYPSVAVVYTLLAGPPVDLAVEALATWRDNHGERRAGDLPLKATGGGVDIAGQYRVAGPGFTLDPEWYLGVYHRAEAERGLEPTEDLLRVGRFEARLEVGETLEVSAWAGSDEPIGAGPVVEEYRRRMRGLAVPAGDSVEATLRQAADTFIVRTPAGVDVVAGYPWFGAWSRDTMISYEGLFLATGRADEGRELLRGYAATLSQGMLANTADTGRVEHNTADATLWFLHAVDRHVVATGDDDLAAELARPLHGVLRHHLEGTRYGIRVDPADGLLTQGADGRALTWMDAVVGGTAITPRRGKAVELNALWVNGLTAVAGLRERARLDPGDLLSLRDKATASFERRFPTGKGHLYDVVDPEPMGARQALAPADAALRPNQLLAYGLPYGPLRGRDDGSVRAVAGTLVTPLGLRTLDPADPAYRGAHRGDPAGRDRAYHQGTVWPWLIGPYADAARAVGLATDALLDGLVAHLSEWGVGSVSETADGDAPHDATGCPFQAWSVAELLRTWLAARPAGMMAP